jgi:hypothetical protein
MEENLIQKISDENVKTILRAIQSCNSAISKSRNLLTILGWNDQDCVSIDQKLRSHPITAEAVTLVMS